MRNLLIYRLTVFNTCAAAATFYAWQLGYVDQVFAGDVSHISYGIVALFVTGLISTFIRGVKVSKALNGGTADKKLLVKQAHLFDISEWLVLLGLAGNVIGFLIAFHSIDSSSLNSAAGMQKIGIQVLAGLGVAFYSTLAGTICALWTSVNYRMLDTAARLALKGED